MDNASLGRLVGCHPVLVERVERFEQLLDFGIEIVQGKRTFNLQAAFYAQGREPLAVVNDKRLVVGLAPIDATENEIVTKARPGYGWHEYGLAVDAAPLTAELKIDWTVGHSNWQKMLAVASGVGFAEGAEWRTFPDNPHLYPAELPATPGDDIRAAFASGGIEAVWRVLPEPLLIGG